MMADRSNRPYRPDSFSGIPGEFQPQLSLMCYQGSLEQWATHVDETQASLRAHARKLKKVGDALERGEAVEIDTVRRLLFYAVGDLQLFFDLMGFPYVAMRLRFDWWLLLREEYL